MADRRLPPAVRAAVDAIEDRKGHRAFYQLERLWQDAPVLLAEP